MTNLKTKLTSRKFLIAAAGVISGVVLLANGNVTEGVTSIIASVVAYLAAEGLVDMAAVKKTVSQAETVADKMDECSTTNAIGFVTATPVDDEDGCGMTD